MNDLAMKREGLDGTHAVRKFNARNKSFAEVARTFEPPDRFKELADFSNTVVVGPRGSGKTTLLKMLHPAALGEWRDKRAADIQERVIYSGVYVPTDRLWQTQLESLGAGHLEEDVKSVVGRAVTSAQIQAATVQTMLYRSLAPLGSFLASPLSSDGEIELVRALSDDLQLPVRMPTLGELLNSLQSRINRIYAFASAESFRGQEGRASRLADNPDLHQDFLTGVLSAVSRFNSAVSEPGRVWALLFDELEIAPKWLTESLFSLLRSTDQRLLFKLSTSPVASSINTFLEPGAPTEGNDFTVIRLWSARKELQLPFTKRLLERLFNELGVDTSPGLHKILPSDSTTNSRVKFLGSNKGDSYLPGGDHYVVFERLRQIDPAFDRFFAERRIDLTTWSSMTENRRAEVRKITPIVHARFLRFSVTEGGTTRKRSRKTLLMPAGYESLCTVVEGNPRLLTQIVSGLWSSSKEKRVFRAVQQRKEVDIAIRRYFKYLETVPVQSSHSEQEDTSASELVDVIGSFFERSLFDKNRFSPEPHLSLFVDDVDDMGVLEALAVMLNAGALFLDADEGSGATILSLKGHRCRLSYLLHAHYGLPFILGEEISLSEVFRRRAAVGVHESQLRMSLADD